MEVWSGCIESLSNDNLLQGLCFIDPSSTGQSNIPKDSKLFVSAFVNPAVVPLYLQSGPLLEVHTTNGDTASWLKDRLLARTLLDQEHRDGFQVVQCPTAVLLRVEDPSKRGGHNAKSTWENVTDILLYGVLGRTSEAGHPTTANNDDDGCCDHLRMYAVCLCAGREIKAQALPSPPQSPRPEDDKREAETAKFLPDMVSPGPKRKRVSTLFDAATEFHKKAQRRGGIGISDFGKKERPQQSADSSYMHIRRARDNANLSSQGVNRGPSQVSSSLGFCGRLRSSTLPTTATTIERPRAKSISGRRDNSSPFTNATTYSQFSDERRLQTGSYKAASCEQTMSANKTLLTRTILTSMRLYGYRRSSRSTARPTTPATPFPDSTSIAERAVTGDGDFQDQSSFDADDDEEFKAMYHATYRATMFALRQFLKPCHTCMPRDAESGYTGDNRATCISGLGRDRAVHMVDSILKLFCEGQG